MSLSVLQTVREDESKTRKLSPEDGAARVLEDVKWLNGKQGKLRWDWAARRFVGVSADKNPRTDEPLELG